MEAPSFDSDSANKRPKVVIVGAGIAGLVAAHRLQSTGGFDVVVLEGSDRVGGRVHTSTFKGKKVEFGAQWIHGIKGSPVYALAKEEGLMDSQEEASEESESEEEEADFEEMLADISMTCTNEGTVIDKALRREVGKFYKDLHGQAEKEGVYEIAKVDSVGEFLDRGLKGWLDLGGTGKVKEAAQENHSSPEQASTLAPKKGVGPQVAGGAVSRSAGNESPARQKASSETPEEVRALKQAVFDMRKRLECNIAGTADLKLLDLKTYADYWEFPGPQLQIPGGYSGVAEALVRKLAPGSVHFKRNVSCIHWGPKLTTKEIKTALQTSGEQAKPLGSLEGLASGPPIVVECQNGENFAADHVVVTVSLGVLKERAAASPPSDAFCGAERRGSAQQQGEEAPDRQPESNSDAERSERSKNAELKRDESMHCGTALFDPPLPETKQAAIQRMGFGVVDKAFVDFERQPLPQGCGSLELAWLDGIQGAGQSLPDWVHDLFSFGGPNGLPTSLMYWLHGKAALQMESLPPYKIAQEVSATLQVFRGGKPVPKTADVAHSNWATDPLFRGSYSYVAVGSSEDDVYELARPLPYDTEQALMKRLTLEEQGAVNAPSSSEGEGRHVGSGRQALVARKEGLRVLFAGEATHPHYYSTTHGAWLSGLREAERLVDEFKVEAGDLGGLKRIAFGLTSVEDELRRKTL